MINEIIYTDSAMRDRIKEAIESDSDNFKTVQSITPTTKLYVDVTNPSYVDYYLANPTQFREQYKKAILIILTELYPGILVSDTFKGITISFTSKKTILLHDINPQEHENAPISFNCEIVAGDNWKTYIKTATGYCPKCTREFEFKADFDKSLKNLLCNNVGCKFCKVEIDKKTIVTGYVQTILIQEPLTESKFSNPVTFEAKIYDKDVGTAFPGQKKLITGIFHSKIGKENEHDIFIEVTSMIDKESTKILMPTEEEISSYREDSKKEGFQKLLIDSFAPTIYSNRQYEDIKLSILLQLVGGKKGKKRSDINQILVGDPSMAKSVMLKFAKSITQKSLYTSGKGTTSAGLTIGIVTLDSGRKVAMAGVLPICDGGYAMIDEFDKMSQQDRSSIHEAMEQQTTSIAKAGIIMSLSTKTSILAAANPIGGKYDSDSTLSDNLNLTSTILSRFDLIWLIVDKVDAIYDDLKADTIINDFFDEDINEKEIYLDIEHLTSYLNYARELEPNPSNQLRLEAKKLYRKLRQASKSESAVAVGTRQLEGILRLTYAHAKLMLKDEADMDDLEIVTKLMKSSYKSLNVDLESGESLNNQLVSASDSKEIIIHKVWRLCENDRGLVNGKDYISALVDTNKFTRPEASKILVTLQMKSQIYTPASGYWKKSAEQL
jgi:replicative DNA helicase Mcm